LISGTLHTSYRMHKDVEPTPLRTRFMCVPGTLRMVGCVIITMSELWTQSYGPLPKNNDIIFSKKNAYLAPTD
jgi:hypothetical protein